jgi:heme A synthase
MPVLTAAVAALLMSAILDLLGAWPVVLQIGLGAAVYVVLAGPLLWRWARQVRSASSR